MMAAILISANLNSTILDLALLVFPLKLTHNCQDWVPPFAQKNFTHSFSLNLMIPAILNSAIMDSNILHKMNFTHSFWFKLVMGSILNSSILISSILDSAILHKTLTQISSIWLKLIHSYSTWWWQLSWILPSWIQPFSTRKNFTH